jgi:CheY-like chemotaxis protein
MNLCINARDAMQGKGEMRVCMQVINAQALICTSCGQQVDGRFLQISVQDSGQGIKPELLAQIFDPFFTTKEVGKGTGMGLSVVHGIAHEHQGHVVVEERPGGGSSFNLLFPIIKANPEAQTLTNDRMKPHHSATAMSILVAEDEPVLARYLSELLENQGYRVTACNNGREALTHLQQAPMAYDLLITDQTMPEMTGLELTQALRRTRAQLPVILCSGFSDCLDEQVALGMGVSRYFQKPVDAGELLAAIDNCLLTIDEPSQKRAISGN